MDIETLELFVEVARLGGFSAVAHDRHIDASSVSRAISRLETELGARLFQRTTRKLIPTEAGQIYLERVAPIVKELARAREEVESVRGEPTGPVRLTTSVAFGKTFVMPLLPAYRSAFPRIRLELLLTDSNLDLIEERIDVAIRLAPSYRAGVIGSKLFATRYRVVCSPEWRRSRTLREPVDLSGESCLLFSLPEFRSRWLFRRSNMITEVPVNGELVSSSVLALQRAAIDGLGPTLLADWLIGEDLDAGRLVDLFPEYDVTATNFETAAWLLYASRDHLPRKVRLTLDFFRERLGRSQAPGGK